VVEQPDDKRIGSPIGVMVLPFSQQDWQSAEAGILEYWALTCWKFSSSSSVILLMAI
jgi:hypothetical protein